MRLLSVLAVLAAAALLPSCRYTGTILELDDLGADVVVYGGTPGGVAAAVQVARMGRSVLLISPDAHLGGMTTAGLGFTDVGRREVVGGIGREFYQGLGAYYRTDDDAWRWQAREDFTFRAQHSRGGGTDDDGAVWVFEPSAAQVVMDELVKDAGVTVLRARLDRAPGATVVDERRIRRVTLEDGRTVQGRMFVDATYEGDLLAAAGVSYVVGREPNARYGESLNGVQNARATKHQFPDGIDPWRVAGDPASGLLPGLDVDDAPDGSGDARVQAYCFRLCLTDHPENRVPFPRPDGYDEADYELLFRLLDTGYTRPWMTFSAMPDRKTDTNNHGPVSTDAIGLSHEWPEASYERRAELFDAHVRWQQGLIWTLANHPRVPAEVRAQLEGWGLAADEFTGSGSWPDRLYVREGRRMVGDEVVTELHCLGERVCEWPVGMAAYTMDSHNVRRTVTFEPPAPATGWVKNEGDVQVGGFDPFPIGYGALVPRREECANLLVPVGLSATHMAFGSIRMEPVFFVLGQAAGTAAVHALEEGVAVQAIDRERLTARLLADGARLTWPVEAPAAAAAGE